MARIKVIHVNQAVLKRNRKCGEDSPPLTIKTKSGGKVSSAHEAIVVDAKGYELLRVVYRPRHPLSCGATVWCETRHRVILLDREETDMAEKKSQEQAATESKAPKTAKVKMLNLDLVLKVKAPPGLSPTKLARALKKALLEATENGLEGSSDKDQEMLDQVEVKSVVPTAVETETPRQAAPAANGRENVQEDAGSTEPVDLPSGI